MSLPDQQLSSTPVPGTVLGPDVLTTDRRYDYEWGGIALNDASQGLRVQVWTAYIIGDDIVLDPDDGPAQTLLSVPGGVAAVSLAFDRNMRPVVAYVTSAGLTRLFWYDTLVADEVDTPFPGIENPRVCHDDKRDMQASSSDVIFAYTRDGDLYYREQRDRYGVERLLQADIGAVRLRNIGMGDNLRLHFVLA